jgi:enamine deaminase RidA (YjgF/YER057c/UK114 family)
VSVADRLKELGIELPVVNPPLAVYRPAVRSGNLVIVSGQLAMKDGALLHPGKLGASVTVEQGYEAARACAVNVLAAANTLLGSLEGVRILRTVGYVSSTPEFLQHPAVVNGASELFRDVLGEEDGIGARCAFGVAVLPLDSPVEVEVMMEVRS